MKKRNAQTAERPTRFIAIHSEHVGGRFPVRYEVHEQEYGNHNYVLVQIDLADHGLIKAGRTRVLDGGPTFTVFTKSADCGRGEYAEELDIQLSRNGGRRGQTAAVKRIAATVLKSEYESGLRIAKVVERFGMF